MLTRSLQRINSYRTPLTPRRFHVQAEGNGHPRVVILGGGVVGGATAHFLSKRIPGSNITVVEKDPSYCFASSALSAGSIRHQFSTAESIKMSIFGTDFLKNLEEHLGVDGDVPSINFTEGGYLFLASESGKEILRSNHALQVSLGANISLLEPQQLKDRWPWLNTNDIALGAFGESGEGWFDGYSLVMAFRKKTMSEGVHYHAAQVVGLRSDKEAGRVEAVVVRDIATGGTTELPCTHVINATGPAAATITRMLGFDIPVRNRKRFVFVFNCRTLDHTPLTIDPSGTYFRPENRTFITGVSPARDEDFDVDAVDFDVNHELFEERIWPVIAERVPAFEDIKLVRSWAGHYEFNTFDQNAFIGPHHKWRNFFLANGFSGHGLQHSPATGRALSELILDGKYTTLDLSCFSFSRYLENRPLFEKNVV